ncbi:hypothetical protein GX51_04404 [Blastomyces parvus]|uniref:Uncharacterized protein n=1 Tax=Blastomyces parvus TaxID=2060905 RepID=A0A2B7X1W5_9EURO|nr:hypothetical protein GX51_04404 [Blastomyces parvus]
MKIGENDDGKRPSFLALIKSLEDPPFLCYLLAIKSMSFPRSTEEKVSPYMATNRAIDNLSRQLFEVDDHDDPHEVMRMYCTPEDWTREQAILRRNFVFYMMTVGPADQAFKNVSEQRINYLM